VHRIRTGLHAALQEQETVLIVAHGGVYWAVQEVLGLAPADIDNCCALLHHPPVHPATTWHVKEI